MDLIFIYQVCQNIPLDRLPFYRRNLSPSEKKNEDGRPRAKRQNNLFLEDFKKLHFSRANLRHDGRLQMIQLEMDEYCLVFEDYFWQFPKSIRPFSNRRYQQANAAESSRLVNVRISEEENVKVSVRLTRPNWKPLNFN